MRDEEIHPTITTYIRESSARILKHPFLERCQNGKIPLEALRVFLVQHGKYSTYFTRYLCALISNLKESSDVLHLAENLAEELGFGDGKAGSPHSQIYADLLKGFNLSSEAQPAFPETIIQIKTAFMLCRQPDGIEGLGALCLGAEAIVPALYSAVVNGFHQHGIADDKLNFLTSISIATTAMRRRCIES
jgi:pyrroloquinoline quinone (PQQ) biosynthesis protein C